MKLLGLIIITGLIGLSAGCINPAAPTKAAVAWRTHLQFQPISSLHNPPEYVLHQATISRKGQDFDVLAQIEFSADGLTLAGLTHSGLRLFLLQFSDSLSYEAHDLLPGGLKGKYILGDLQVIYWPAESLRAGGLTIKEPEAGLREVYKGTQKLISVRYAKPNAPWQSEITYENHQRNYRITITPAALQ